MDWPRSATATCTCRRFTGFLLGSGLGCRRTGDATVGALAAVLREVTDEPVHGAEVGGLEQGAALAPLTNQARMAQTGEMERERGRSEIQLLADGAHGEALRPRLHQQAVDGEAALVGQGAQGTDGGL